MSLPRESQDRQSAAPAADGRAELLLRLLIVASLVLPVTIFSIASWISYNAHFAEARDRLERTLDTIHEHAAKVFETFEISERYMEQLFNGVSDADVRAHEREYSNSIRTLIKNLPQLRDLWLIANDGRPLVSGTIYPMPSDLQLADRDYFRVHKEGDVDTFISEVVDARAASTSFFAITRKRRTPDGRFDGIYLVSIAPEYFTKYYSELPPSDVDVAELVRGDGAILARYASTGPGATRFPSDSPLMTAIHAHPGQGIFTGVAFFEQKERIYAYSKLPNDNVYVVAGIDTSTVRSDWIRDMSAHLLFGIPATLMMFTLALLTLRRTRRESLAYAQLREETARRQSTELALLQAQKMEAVGRLTGGIAHDFNNLLTAIIGNVELALRRNDSTDGRLERSLSSIRQASLRAATLVQRLLSFSRQHPQEVKTVDINRLVQDMSELLHRTIGETITVETVLASGLWKAAIDPNQLENAIINLAVNARDAMPASGRLTIETSNAYLDESYVMRAASEIKAGQFVMIAVSDTGSGMNSDTREKAFEPFFTTKPTGAGSGLGLSMVYGFVRQSNGHIQIYSEVGEGTSIKMYFPRLLNEKAFPAWDEIEAPLPPKPSSHNERILLVEDDEDVNRFVAETLGEIGYRVDRAHNAAAALAILEKTPDIALLLTDVVLPGGMNGRQLADEVKKIRPDLPVLFATGYTRNAIIHHGRLDPDVDLLVKPFTTDALARKVRQMLDRPKDA